MNNFLQDFNIPCFVISYSASCVALEDGALEPVLRLSCTSHCNAVSLVAVSTLSLIAEEMSTHTKILESPLSVLTSVCSLASSEDEQVKGNADCILLKL